MKECEVYSTLKVPCSSKVIIRIDGRNFRQLSDKLNIKKPYDEDFAKIMALTCVDMFKEFSPRFVYTFSDEINLLLDEVPFGGRIEKLNSVFASYASSSFTKNLQITYKLSSGDIKPVSFDSRVLPLSSEVISSYFHNRQSEAWRNCMNGYAYWTLREKHSKEDVIKILRNKKSSALHEIMYAQGINLSKLPPWQRRGIGIYREKREVEGFNPQKKEKVISIRKNIYQDWNLPLFSKQAFLEKFLE